MYEKKRPESEVLASPDSAALKEYSVESGRAEINRHNQSLPELDEDVVNLNRSLAARDAKLLQTHLSYHLIQGPNIYLVKTYEALQPYLGSYSFFVCATLTISLVLVLAEFTYRLIEVPGIKFGQKLITHGKYA